MDTFLAKEHRARYNFLRTERIIQSLIESDILDEATIDTLRKNIERGFPRTRKRQHITNQVRILKKKLTPYIGSRNLLVEASANSQTSGPNTYTPELLFDSVVFEDEDTANNVTFTGTDGQPYHIQPVSYHQNNARVRCTCLDFHYRFAAINAKSSDLYGNPPPPYHKTTYQGKTALGRLWSRIRGKENPPPPRRGPPANPAAVPGFCKHLIKLTEELQREGIIKL